MCRLLGIAANEPTEFKIVLREAPRSLAALSREHRDGWGIAVFDAATGQWQLDKGVNCAGECKRFHELAVGSRGEVLVSHIRQKTIGDTALANTHPFQSGRWIFAHNGTVKELDWLRANTCPSRLAEVQGDTDSEMLFAWVLTRLDEAGVTGSRAGADTDRVIGKLARTGRERPNFGAFNFLLSDGESTYAHRFGRSMFLLERTPEDTVRSSRKTKDGMVLETPWSPQRTAVFVASERITDEPWQSIDDATLLRIERLPAPYWRLVAS
jgi:predicted glutamine amidotransferase